jgi:hypothetical protein
MLSICMFLGFSLLTTCGAQSIVGKWKGVSVKNYFSAEYAKQAGNRNLLFFESPYDREQQ